MAWKKSNKSYWRKNLLCIYCGCIIRRGESNLYTATYKCKCGSAKFKILCNKLNESAQRISFEQRLIWNKNGRQIEKKGKKYYPVNYKKE